MNLANIKFKNKIMIFKKAIQVEYKNSFPILEKRDVLNLENKLANQIILADLGGNTLFLEKYSAMKQWEILKNLDNIYEDSIKNGAIDHRPLDNFFAENGVASKKCSTKIIVDYNKTVLKLIKKYNIIKVETHKESDADAISSSYLLQALIQKGKLPVLATELAEIVNRLDYGEFDESTDVFFHSIIGAFYAVKNILASRGRKALGKEVFANIDLQSGDGGLNKEGRTKLREISDKYENLRNQYSFEILNAANKAKFDNIEFSLLTDMPSLMPSYSPELREILELGMEKLYNALERFEAGFRNSEIIEASIKDRQGKVKQVNILLGACSNPTLFTNFAYSRTAPDTIVAVYREEKGIGIEEVGDLYDVGVKVEEVENLNLIGIWQALNAAEKKKRDEIYQKAEADRSSREQSFVERWENQRERTFAGLENLIELKKDPVALVAGNSLIAAPRTALLSKEEFFAVLKSFKK